MQYKPLNEELAMFEYQSPCRVIRLSNLMCLFAMLVFLCACTTEDPIVGEWEQEGGSERLVFKQKGNIFEFYEGGELVGTGKWFHYPTSGEVEMDYNNAQWTGLYSDSILSLNSKRDHPVVFKRKVEIHSEAEE